MLEMIRQLARLAPDHYKSINHSRILKTNRPTNEEINRSTNTD
jgi:hypothetical protein